MSDEDVDIELWGWENFFHELEHFLESSGRCLDTASQSYAGYVVERLETCIIYLNAFEGKFGRLCYKRRTNWEL